MERFHIGTMGWSYAFWIGNFYPQGVKLTDFLAEYSKHLDTVEADNTFYRIPSINTLEKWKEQTPSSFIISPKFPRVITHRKMLKNCERELHFFLERISTLEGRLGPLLLQLPPAFGVSEAITLREFLTALPKKYRYAVEVRNNNLLNEKLFSLLKENRVSLVLVAGSSMSEISEITTDFVYIRWEGDRSKVNGTLGKVELDRTDDIKQWAQKIRMLGTQTKEVYGYFSKYYSGHPPTDARRLLESLDMAMNALQT